MSSQTVDKKGDRQELFVNSRREAAIIFLVWAACLVWAVPYCYLNGYKNHDPATIWGIPSWLFWGIGLPWLVADVFTTWFCFCYMKDDDLNEAVPTDADSTKAKGGEK